MKCISMSVEQQKAHPDAFLILVGDLNHADQKTAQTGETRENSYTGKHVMWPSEPGMR